MKCINCGKIFSKTKWKPKVRLRMALWRMGLGNLPGFPFTCSNRCRLAIARTGSLFHCIGITKGGRK